MRRKEVSIAKAKNLINSGKYIVINDGYIAHHDYWNALLYQSVSQSAAVLEAIQAYHCRRLDDFIFIEMAQDKAYLIDCIENSDFIENGIETAFWEKFDVLLFG